MNDDKKEKDKNFTKVQNEILRCPFISTNARLVYAILCSYNPSFPSYSLLRKLTNFGRSKISDCLQELTARKIISYEKGNSCKKANQYLMSKIEGCDLTSPGVGLVKRRNGKINWSQRTTSHETTSPGVGPELVPVWDSNKSKVKKPNIKKSKEEKMKKLKLVPPDLSAGAIPEFSTIDNTLLQEILKGVSQKVQRNWVEIYREEGEGLEWLKREIVYAAAHYATTQPKNYGTAITNWLKKTRTPPPWEKKKEDRKEKEVKVANELVDYFHGDK